MKKNEITAGMAEIYRQIQEQMKSIGNFSAISSHKTMYITSIERDIKETLGGYLKELAKEYGIELSKEALEVVLDKERHVIRIGIPYNLILDGQDTEIVAPFLTELEKIFGTSLQYPATPVTRKIITLEVN